MILFLSRACTEAAEISHPRGHSQNLGLGKVVVMGSLRDVSLRSA